MHYKALASRIRNCRLCEPHLPAGPNPIFRMHPEARIALFSQAPGRKAHESRIPYRDPSGRRLREWLGVSEELFYETPLFAIIPMGFCYPGKANTGDQPPRPECAPHWHQRVLAMMPNIQLNLFIGQYAQRYYLGRRRKKTLTDTVRAWREYAPRELPLPHPSPLNNGWLKGNAWFGEEVLPFLRKRVVSLQVD